MSIEFNLFGGTNATGTYHFSAIPGRSKSPSQILLPPRAPRLPISCSGFLRKQTSSRRDKKRTCARTTGTSSSAMTGRHSEPHPSRRAAIRLLSPFAEKDDRLSTLDYNSGFTRVAPVQPNEIGRVSGVKYARTLVSPDHNNLSPHLGFAWQASRSTVVRSAYGIDYTVGLYGSCSPIPCLPAAICSRRG